MWCWWQKLDRRLAHIEQELKRIRFMVSRPKPLGSVVIREVPMKGYQFGFVLPERPESDSDWAEVESGRLTVTRPGGETTFATEKSQQLTADRVFTDESLVEAQDTPVKGVFEYIDDAGNVSLNPVSVEFLVTDTIPPVDPKALGGIMIREVDLPDPVPPMPEA